jgi:hypothetical protein
MLQTNRNADFWVEVKHRRPLPKRYTWEIHRKGVCLSVEESCGEFGSWEEASQVGNKALKQFLQVSYSRPVHQLRSPGAATPCRGSRSEEARIGLAGIPVESVVALTVLLKLSLLLIVEWPKIKSTYIPLTSA